VPPDAALAASLGPDAALAASLSPDAALAGSTKQGHAARVSARILFPFSAIVGQDEMKLALLIAAVDATLGGVLVFGDRGTGKSTAVRALAALLPEMPVVVGCS